MRVEKITYKDFNGDEHTETHCFHLDNVERMRIDASCPGGLQAYVAAQINSGTMGGILNIVEKIIMDSHGIKTIDGSHFKKSAEINEEFVSSGAYNALITKLFEGDDAADKVMEFVSNIVGETYSRPVLNATPSNTNA